MYWLNTSLNWHLPLIRNKLTFQSKTQQTPKWSGKSYPRVGLEPLRVLGMDVLDDTSGVGAVPPEGDGKGKEMQGFI